MAGDVLARLATAAGVHAGYTDAFGRQVAASDETRRAVLAAFRLAAGSEAEARESLARIERERAALHPTLLAVTAGRAGEVPLSDLAAGGEISWEIATEQGGGLSGREAAGTGAIRLPALPAGYHQVRTKAGSASATATLLAAPARCFLPGVLAESGRLWGSTVQIYALRSADDLGIGGYREIAEMARGSGRAGASFLGLSPVHALFAGDRTKISPYSPSSRLFLETSFIDPTVIDGFDGSAAARLAVEGEFTRSAAALRGSSLVDHAASWELKRQLLDRLWEERRDRRNLAFESFRRLGGELLEAHATFEALSEQLKPQGHHWLGDWPEAYRASRSPEVRAFREQNRERVAFHAWLQWLADEQLGQAARQARSAGMPVGLYRDLAVGSDRGGSEIWSHPDRFAPALSIGAPPDLLGPAGQNWGLPPFNPRQLAADGLAAFRALVAANMRHAGAIRIDHAFQLQRLYLIPEGANAAEGTYVDYPFDALLAVLKIESHRNRCVVIAEDLGTAPEGFSDAIMGAGLLSTRVVAFERRPDGSYKSPGEYPREAMAVLSTHDLPTVAGSWSGADIELRRALGAVSEEAAERMRAERAEDRARLAEALAAESLLPSPEAPDDPPTEAVSRFLARTPCCLAALQIEDVLGLTDQANIPGPDIGHPNWRRRLNMTANDIFAPGSAFTGLAAAMRAEGRAPRTAATTSAAVPRATYRLQFHKDFTFDHAAAIVPYLAGLGISHVYASPIQKARPGSTHGYDIVQHDAINPELGGEEGLLRLSTALKEHGLGLVLDIVPNHMGVGGSDSPWWLSVLEWGQLSPFADAFDIDWERLGAHGKLVVPVLGERYGDALEQGQLQLRFDAGEGSFSVWHWEHRLPVSPLTYPIILDRALAALDDVSPPAHADVLAVSERLRAMEQDEAPDRRRAFPEEAERFKERIAAAAQASPELAGAIERAVTFINGVADLPESFGTLHRILELQSYRPAHWRVAASDINYRRFFDINGLGGLRVELPEVFERTHELVARLVRDGIVDGLRIDHIDGLADPEGYLRALRSLVGPDIYIVVEKILEPGEPLRPWPIAGTSGYDALNLIDGVFVEGRHGAEFERIYREATGLEGSYGELTRETKAEVLESSFASELEVLVSDLKRIADADRRTRDYTAFAMRRALIEIIARFPVYRSYVGEEAPSEADRELIERTVARARRHSTLPDRSVHGFAADALLGRLETGSAGRPEGEHVARFRRRFQQLTGPVMAKSVEDTLFYRYLRLIALNEVGGDPHRFGIAPDDFHRQCAERARAWPHAMLGTATHDTKRGEDARARLLALTQFPEAWRALVRDWEAAAAPLARDLDGAPAPDANDRFLLLQTLLATLPFELMEKDDPSALGAYRGRVHEYLTKALREAKRHTSWVNTQDDYEAATLDLATAVLTPGGPLLKVLRPLARPLAAHGALASLARTALKLTMPGVPDIYQGTEFWDLSMVDPDNRRPVDYAARVTGLEAGTGIPDLLPRWRDGRVKQALTARLLADRGLVPGLYADGDWRPVEVQVSPGIAVLAFERTLAEERLFVVVPCRIGEADLGEALRMPAASWSDSRVAVPPGEWRDLLVEGRTVSGGERSLAELFAATPVAVLRMGT